MAQIMSPAEASGQNTNFIEITDSDDEDTPAQQAPTRLTSTPARGTPDDPIMLDDEDNSS